MRFETQIPRCMEPGCTTPAECIPRLWVPAHPLSAKKFDGVASVMGLPYCFRHFHLLKPRDFLRSQEVRDSITADFRKKGAVPWFDRATLHQVRKSEPEFLNALDLLRLARATASA